MHLEKVQYEVEISIRPKDRLLLKSLHICEECFEETIIVPDPTLADGTVHCFFCGTRFLVSECERCGSYIFSSVSSHSSNNEDELEFCEFCWDDMHQRIAYD